MSPAEPTPFNCGLCGLDFTHGGLACGSCALGSACSLVRCPRCGYQFPRESSVERLLRWLLGRFARPQGGAAGALADVPPETRARVLFVPSGALQVRLAHLGLVVGALVDVLQTTPAVLVRVSGTTLAVEREVGARILVRRENGG